MFLSIMSFKPRPFISIADSIDKLNKISPNFTEIGQLVLNLLRGAQLLTLVIAPWCSEVPCSFRSLPKHWNSIKS